MAIQMEIGCKDKVPNFENLLLDRECKRSPSSFYIETMLKG